MLVLVHECINKYKLLQMNNYKLLCRKYVRHPLKIMPNSYFEVTYNIRTDLNIGKRCAL